jgi:FlaG/FlaF family flagellin (archaellin)
MIDDGDTILNLVGVALVVLIVAAVGVLVLAGTSGNSPSDDVPAASVNWTLDRVNDTHVRIVHSGGEPIDSERVFVTVNAKSAGTSWPTLIREGDAGVVVAEEGDIVRLFWLGETDEETLIETWRL